MEDADTVPRDPAHPHRARRSTRGRLPPSAAHHRRRRAWALIAVAAVALVIGVAVGAGSGSGGGVAKRAAVSSPGYFAEIKALAGDGPASFVAYERAAENAAIDAHARLYAVRPDRRVPAPRDRADVRRRPRPVHAARSCRCSSASTCPATFFEVGVAERYFHASTSAIVADGYPIGDHTEIHARCRSCRRASSRPQLLEQARGDRAQYGAPFPRLFRPPYGLWDSDDARAAAASTGC